MNIRPPGAAEPAGEPARSTSPWRAKNPVVSFRHAAEGIAHAFRTQRNMRFHVAAFSAIFLAGLMLRLPRLEMIALIFSCALVLMAEMINTAIEAAVDMITDRYHPGAKFVKDIAAGSVLVAAITAAVVGATIFLGALQLETTRGRMLHPSTVPQAVGAFLLLMVAVLVMKVLAGKGSLLRGGAVSGHSAAAFFLAAVVVVVVPHPVVAVLVFLLAGIVAQSRVEAGIHTLREVVIGAVAALAIAVAVLRGPVWLARWLPERTVPVAPPGAR